ncbi:hypothetical protein Syun_020866 [Stephania yunnanensis]|uniref:magnesium chelatase n=1 Tax=Stephania yunnanensis TaxID=152371 RepID=A0AAP0NQ39_9MAGN
MASRSYPNHLVLFLDPLVFSAIGVKSTLIIMEVIPFLVLVRLPHLCRNQWGETDNAEWYKEKGIEVDVTLSCYGYEEMANGKGKGSRFESLVRELNSKNRYASFEVVGYLAEELRDESTYKTFCKDLEDANVFSGSLIFVEELAQKIKSAVEKERDRLEALFKRKKQSSAGFADSMLKLVRTLPKVLKYLPSDKAQYARLYILSLQFWLGGFLENLQNFLKMIFDFGMARIFVQTLHY